jgi:hypothetical protein
LLFFHALLYLNLNRLLDLFVLLDLIDFRLEDDLSSGFFLLQQHSEIESFKELRLILKSLVNICFVLLEVIHEIT